MASKSNNAPELNSGDHVGAQDPTENKNLKPTDYQGATVDDNPSLTKEEEAGQAVNAGLGNNAKIPVGAANPESPKNDNDKSEQTNNAANVEHNNNEALKTLADSRNDMTFNENPLPESGPVNGPVDFSPENTDLGKDHAPLDASSEVTAANSKVIEGPLGTVAREERGEWVPATPTPEKVELENANQGRLGGDEVDDKATSERAQAAADSSGKAQENQTDNEKAFRKAEENYVTNNNIGTNKVTTTNLKNDPTLSEVDVDRIAKTVKSVNN